MLTERTILLVEDEPMISELYRTVLTQHQYVVILAHNKQSALFLLEQHRPSLVLLDLMIPVGAGEGFIEYDHPVGFDVLEWAHHHPEFAAVKFVVITNLDSEEHRKHALQLGAAAYLVKADVEPIQIVRQVDSIAQG